MKKYICPTCKLEQHPGRTCSRTSLFAVIINVDGDDETGCGIYDVRIVDRYSHPGHVLYEGTDLDSLDKAMEFAKGAVTVFMSKNGP